MAATPSLEGSVFKPRVGAAIAPTSGAGIVVVATPGFAPAPKTTRAGIDPRGSLIRSALLLPGAIAEGAPLV
jgi:hypothetical protein